MRDVAAQGKVKATHSKEGTVPANQRQKARLKGNTVQTLQTSLGISGPSKRTGSGAAKQTLHESLRVGNSGHKRTAPKIGKNHLRDSMGIG